MNPETVNDTEYTVTVVPPDDTIAGGITRETLADAIALMPNTPTVADACGVLVESFFESLKPQPVPWWGTDPWVLAELEKLHRGELDFSAMVLADQMDEWEEPVAAAALRQACDKKLLADEFRLAMRSSMLEPGLHTCTSLIRAKQQIAHRILSEGFVWWYIKRASIDAVNDFTRTRMREDGFYRRIMPPLPVTGSDLDLAVPTDAPVTVGVRGTTVAFASETGYLRSPRRTSGEPNAGPVDGSVREVERPDADVV